MVKIMENPIKMDDLGVPLFSETSIWIHMVYFLSGPSCQKVTETILCFKLLDFQGVSTVLKKICASQIGSVPQVVFFLYSI